MNTIDNLKLRNIEVLDSMTLRAAASSNGSSGSALDGGSLPEVVVYGSAGSKSSSGSSTEGAMGSYFASWYYGSGSGSDSSSGSGSGGFNLYIPCKNDECQSNQNCGNYKVCDKVDCGLFGSLSSYKKCRDMSSRERACVNKTLHQECEWLKDDGFPAGGYCNQPTGAPALYCYWQRL